MSDEIQNNTNKKKLNFLFWIIPAIILIIVLYFGFTEGTKNKLDPYWIQLDTLLFSNGIRESSQSIKISEEQESKFKLVHIKSRIKQIDSIYNLLHHNSSDITHPESLLCKPFLPSWEYNKFLKFVNPLIKKKFIIIYGVTGSGKTTIVDRIAKFISGNTKRVIRLQCVERMEIEYHKQWIGEKNRSGFVKGKILDFFEKCHNDPEHNYLFILDDFDKIFPSTFFGSEIWDELNERSGKNVIDGYGEITIPDNFYMISITHFGVGNTVEINNEHIRRLGEPIPLDADVNELLLYIIERTEKKKLNAPYSHIKKLLYTFKKANEFINENYDDSYTLGQWSTLKDCLKPEDYNKFVNTFIIHVNAFKPQKQLHISDFEPIEYTIKTNGYIINSNFFAEAYKSAIDTGVFSELSVAIAFTIISALAGWFVILRKKKVLREFHYFIIETADNFKNGKINYEDAMQTIIEKKQQLQNMIVKRKIKYEEITFLFLFIDDQIKKIEETNRMSIITKDFYKIFEEFMKDGILDESEYTMLGKFLDNIRSAISPELYFELKTKINDLRKKTLINPI
jgi:adenylate kinase